MKGLYNDKNVKKSDIQYMGIFETVFPNSNQVTEYKNIEN